MPPVYNSGRHPMDSGNIERAINLYGEYSKYISGKCINTIRRQADLQYMPVLYAIKKDKTHRNKNMVKRKLTVLEWRVPLSQSLI